MFAEDRKLNRMLGEADSSFRNLASSASGTKKVITDYIAPVKEASSTTKKLSEAQKTAKKTTDDLAESNKALMDGFQSKIAGLEKEIFAFGKSEIQIYKYGLEHERFGKNNLKFNASQIATLMTEKKRIISLKEAEEATKKASEATKKHKEEIANIAKSYADELKSAKLNTIEIEQGVLARVKAELSTKKLGAAVTAKALKDKAEALAINASNKLIKASLEARKSLIATVKKESQTIKLNFIEITKGSAARYAEELKIKGVKGAIASKLTLDFKENELLKKKNKAIKTIKEARASATKEIIKESQTLKLNFIELTKGKAARYAAELGIKKIKGALADKLKFDFKENELLKLKNKAIEKSNSARKSAVDVIKNQKNKLSLLILEYKKDKDAVFLQTKATEKYTEVEAKSALQRQKSIKEYTKLISQKTSYTEKLKELNAKKKNNNILMEFGTEAAYRQALATEYGSTKRADEIITREAGIKLQDREIEGIKKLDDVMKDLLSGKIDSFGQLGDAIVDAFDNGRLNNALDILSKKVGDVLRGGSTKGLGGSILSVFEVDNDASGLGQAIQSYGTGSSVAGTFGADDNTKKLAGITSAIGAAIGSVVPGIGTALGSALGTAWGTVVGGLFGGNRPVKATFGGEDSSGSHWYGTKRNETGKSFVRDTAFGQFGVRGGDRAVTSSLGRYEEGEIEGVMAFLDSMEIVDKAIASFLPASVVGDVKSSLKSLEVNSRNMQEVAKARLSAIFSAMPLEISKFVDINKPMEAVVARIGEIALISEQVVPALDELGLTLGYNKVQTLSNTIAVSDAGGGIEAFTGKIKSYASNYYSAAEVQKTASTKLISNIDALNSELGLSGDNYISNKDQLREFIEAQDLNTEAGKKAFTTALDNAKALAIFSDTVDALKPSLLKLNLNLGSTSQATSKTVVRLAGMEGSVEALGEKIQSYTANYYSEAEVQSAISDSLISNMDALNKELGLSGYSYISNKDQVRKHIKAQDLSTKAGLKAFSSIMKYQESLAKVSDAVDAISPSLLKLGLNIGSTSEASTKAILQVAGMAGGIDSFNEKITAFSSNFTDATTTSKTAADGLIADLSSLNTGLGLSGDALITNKAQLLEQIKGLDLTTEAGQGAVLTALKYQESLLTISNTVEALTPAFSTLNLNLGNTSTVITETMVELAGMAGGVEKLQLGLNSYYQSFYSQEEQKDIALAQSALSVQTYIEGLTEVQQKQLSDEGIRAFVEGLDLKEKAEKEAFISSLAVSESMKAVADSGKTMSEILAKAPASMIDMSTTLAGEADKTAGALGGLGDAINILADSAISATRAAQRAAQTAADNASAAQKAANDAVYANSNPAADGSHFGGMVSVPYDGYLAETHYKEMIIDSASASAIKRYFGADVSRKATPSIVINQAPQGRNLINARPIFAHKSPQGNDELIKEIRGLREDNKKLQTAFDNLTKENKQSNEIKIKQNNQQKKILIDTNEQNRKSARTLLQKDKLNDIKRAA